MCSPGITPTPSIPGDLPIFHHRIAWGVAISFYGTHLARQPVHQWGFFHPARGQKSRLSNGLARVPSYTRLIGVRVCLGVAEAGLFPGVVH